MLLSSNSLRAARPYLGTLVEITVGVDQVEQDVAQPALDAAFSAIERVHQLMSFHDADSDVSRINRASAAVCVQIDPATYTVLQFAEALSQCSAGAFDITIATVLVDQGFLPIHQMHPQRDGVVCYRDLELLDDNQVRWQRQGRVDLGGIAKGYAVDCAIAVLQRHGIRHAIVNAGGDLRCIGRPQQIHIRHPDDPRMLIDFGALRDGALATSAGYYAERQDGQQMINPIVDPAQQRCVAWQNSISVVAAQCMIADALTKVVRLLSENESDRLARILAHFEAQALMLGSRGFACLGSSHLFSLSE